MLIGDRNVFAIECYHEPLPNPAQRVFGRMCIWSSGHRMGDLEEPACMLNVTEGHLQAVLARLDSLHDPSLHGLNPDEAFRRLDDALYHGTGRSTEQVVEDAKRFFRFDFLTNGGESFDRTKSFLVNVGDSVRLIFRDEADSLHSGDIPRGVFTDVIEEFLAWISDEGAKAG
jgi:hypothetical protein